MIQDYQAEQQGNKQMTKKSVFIPFYQPNDLVSMYIQKKLKQEMNTTNKTDASCLASRHLLK